jgi:hypothetical protein
VKRGQLIREIRRAADAKGLTFALTRSTGKHDIYELDGLRIPIPRHREIGPKMTFELFAQAEAKLGERWWR